ncbi:hypothetical protein BpHYR1_028368 [Brachionus plicatilis]|uniref:Uncharacterized protein n=1 Tax=Brachionus plicatilis TaxID=10195 RepID=A0A3M7T601_BRAPC|nr:hypothetical protein BpHYR1_028368 [Brachionus plicatilis]
MINFRISCAIDRCSIAQLDLDLKLQLPHSYNIYKDIIIVHINNVFEYNRTSRSYQNRGF